MSGNNFNGWIDVPVIDAIDYFAGIMQTFFSWATRYAQFVGLLGLCWSAFRLINSRMTIKDFWWDTFYKWFLFIALMSFYAPFTVGLSVLGNKVGIYAGKGQKTVSDALVNMRTAIEKDLAVEKQWEEELSVTLTTNFDNISLPELTEGESYSSYMEAVYEKVNGTKFDSSAQKKKAKEIVEEYKQRKTDGSIYGARTLKAINSVLVEKELDGEDGDTLTDSYIPLNIWLQAKNGDSYYISPAALLRVASLCTQILWEKNQLELTSEIDSIDQDKEIAFMEKGWTKLSSRIHHIPSLVMTMLLCIGIIVCVIFTDIQYIMCILEYTIVTGVGAFFIPFILFDGTKELPKKLVPVFMAFMMKMIIMNIILFFIFNELIGTTIQVMTDTGGINWVSFATYLFFIFLAFILASNGPKIAQTIMTGQPQLSMGEVVQMAGAVAGAAIKGTKLAGKTAKVAGKTAVGVTRGTALAAINTAGGITKMASAGANAAKQTKANGGGKAAAAGSAVKGVFATATSDLKDKMASAGNNFLHGGKKGGGAGGGGGGGSSAHQRYGQNTERDFDGKSRTLSENSNPGFRGATRYDPQTQSNVNMTLKDFFREKAQQGKMVSDRVADKERSRAEKKLERYHEKGNSTLSGSLTGGERLS